ncbi:MAG TPA: cystathionine beta-lyase [Xanthobacteraceae bacterium]|jgi:cysteine-S-conjugate beta-lyase|nr:cystathionine beta-lyase [Xanthobacteraceae bacterium]
MTRRPDSENGGGGTGKPLAPATRLVTAGRVPEEQHGFVNTPIYRGSTVLYPNAEKFLHRDAKYTYGTKGTPTTNSLEVAWTELSDAAGTVLVPSGLAAISIALLSCLKAGDHLLVPDSVYRPTRNFCDSVLKKFGVETTYYDPLLGADVASQFKPNTRAVFTEAPGSLSFEMQDIPAIASVAHARDLIVLMDNTWATPLFFPPHARGVDIAIEAGTKYCSGSSDLLLGMVSANERCWRELRATFDTMAICAGPEDVFLALRGLRTMKVRLKHHQESALAIARWFASRPEVARVLHPALESDPGHAIWKRDFTGASGLFSIAFKPMPDKAAHAFINALTLFGIGASWGGFESLAIPFDCSAFRTATKWEPGGPTIRFHIGLEDVDDLTADLERGFAAMQAVA